MLFFDIGNKQTSFVEEYSRNKVAHRKEVHERIQRDADCCIPDAVIESNQA
jgi:hypothetical protein